MNQQHSLTLTNPWKSTALVVGSLGLLGLAVAADFGVVGPYSPLAAGLGVAGLLFGWIFWFVPKMAPRYCAVAAEAVLDAEGLTVQYPTPAATRRIAFADMASYSVLRNEGLTVRPRQGDALKLHLNYKLHPQGLLPLLQFQQGFRAAVADYQRRNPTQPLIQELGFFRRPVATVVLGLSAALVGWLGWRALRPFASEGAWGGFLLTSLLFAVYALLWWHYRSQGRGE